MRTFGRRLVLQQLPAKRYITIRPNFPRARAGGGGRIVGIKPVKEEKSASAQRRTMKATLEVLAHPTSDTQGCTFIISFESHRYVFGHAFEGLQRQFLERKSRYRNFDKLFLTGNLNWQHLGGLPGLALTLADQREDGQFGIWSGAESILYGIASWRSFLFRPGGMRLVPHVWGEDLDRCRKRQHKLNSTGNNDIDGYQHLYDCPNQHRQQAYVDVNLTIEPVILVDPESHTNRELLSVKEQDQFANIAESLFSGVDNAKPLPKQLLPKSKPDNVSTSYIIQIHSMRGSFQPEKAKELGVPPGRLFGILASGNSITTPNGNIVHPDQVMDKPRRGPRILVVDCPNMSYLDGVINNPAWKAPLSWTWDHSNNRAILNNNNDESQQQVDYVIHILGDDVDPLSDYYKSWIESFGPDTRHLFGHSDFCPDSITLNKLSASILKLREIAPNHFPLWYSANPRREMPQTIVNGGGGGSTNQQQPQCLPLLAGQVIGLFPTRSYDESNVWERGAREWDKFHATHVSPMQDRLIPIKANAEKQEKEQDQEQDDFIGSQVQVTTLGTGSCMPSSYRNVSGTLVRIPMHESMSSKSNNNNNQDTFSILLDCGESTAPMLRRIYGEALDSILKELKVVYISHLHADHHLGLLSIIREWCDANNNRDIDDCKLYIIGPYQIQSFIEEWNTIDLSFDINRIIYIQSGNLLPERANKDNNNNEALTKLRKDTGINRVLTNKARHAPFSFTVVFEFESTFKLAYSGDTKPSQAFINAGKGCTLLIHEATLDNELYKEAEVKNHSTLSQAACVARCMESKITILTHFSQRYPKLPALEVLKSEKFFKKNTISYPFIDKEIRQIIELSCNDEENNLKIPIFVCGFDTFRVTLKYAKAAGKWQSALPLVFIDEDDPTAQEIIVSGKDKEKEKEKNKETKTNNKSQTQRRQTGTTQAK